MDIVTQGFQKQNKHYLKQFKKWLISKKTRSHFVTQHIRNCDYFVNTFLSQALSKPAHEGCAHISMFLGYWIIIKAPWASPSAIKSHAQSLIQFYSFLQQTNAITQNDLDLLLFTIQREKSKWLSSMKWYSKQEFKECFF